MAYGGDIDKIAIQAAFSKIKDDITTLAAELTKLKEEHGKLNEENVKLRQGHEQKIDRDLIASIVRETLKSLQHKSTSPLIKKINKKRKSLVLSRISTLAEKKNMSPSEIKDSIVDTEGLCSKATFYRYMEKMKKRHMIDIVNIDETEVVVKIQ